MHRSEPDDRVGLVRMTVFMISVLLLWAACGAALRDAQAESLEEKLGTVTDYVPKAIAPVEQLVEVARRFKIPMGIEWVERPGTGTPDKMPSSGKRCVKELIEEVCEGLDEEKEEWGAIPLDLFEEGVLRFCLHSSMISTIKGLGLECHQVAPDFDAIDEFLRHRYNYWTDDLPHTDPFRSYKGQPL